MKAKLISFMLLVSATFVFTGCPDKVEPGNSDTGDDTSPVEQPGKPFADGNLFTVQLNDDIMATVGTGDWQSIVYGNGKYVAIGEKSQFGAVMGVYSAHSTDGLNWTLKEQSSTMNLFSSNLIYGNGKFVVSGIQKDSYDNGILYSTDGANWSFKAISQDITMGSIIYTDRFIGISSRYVLESFDGINWTTLAHGVNMNDKPNFYNISHKALAYGKERYVVVDSYGHAFYSTDLVNWSDYVSVYEWTYGDSAPILIFANNKFFVLSSKGIHSSTNGIQWTEISTDGYNGIPKDIVYTNGIFISVSSESILYSTDDCQSWKTVDSGTSEGLNCVCIMQ